MQIFGVIANVANYLIHNTDNILRGEKPYKDTREAKEKISRIGESLEEHNDLANRDITAEDVAEFLGLEDEFEKALGNSEYEDEINALEDDVL